MKHMLTKTIVAEYVLPEIADRKKLTDGRGLYLLVTHTGKYWRYNYRFNGKPKTLALGVYPDISIDDARKAHTDARHRLKSGDDPGAIRREKKQQVRQQEKLKAQLSEKLGQRSVLVSEADLLFDLERQGVRFCLDVPHVPDLNSFHVSALDLITFREDPVLFLATRYGISRDIYLAWMAANHDVQCSAYTKQGRRCKHIIKHQVDAKTFEQMLTARCVQH